MPAKHKEEEHLHHEIVDARARPPRVAVLMSASDPEWRSTTVRVVEFLCSIWGGKHSIIIPTDGTTIDPTFWRILEKFSPDYVYYYSKTGRDVKKSHPEEFNATLEREVARLENDSETRERLRDDISTALERTWADRFGLTVELRNELANRITPFHFDTHFNQIVSGEIPHQLTAITSVLGYTDRPSGFTTFRVPDSVERPWWTAQIGAFPEETLERLRELGMREQCIVVAETELYQFAKWAVRREVDQGPRLFRDEEACFRPPDETAPSPFDMSMSGVGYYGSPMVFRFQSDRFAFVMGDSLADFCLAYCLRQIGYPAVWLPASWTIQLASESKTPLNSCIHSVAHAPGYELFRSGTVKACSMSGDENSIVDALEVLKRHSGVGLNGEIVQYATAPALIEATTEHPIPYCIDSPNHAEIYPFIGDSSAGPIRTPTPNGFKQLKASIHRWVVDIDAGGRAVPAVPHIVEDLIQFGNSAGALDKRVSSSGLSYACPPSGLIIGDEISGNLQRPYITLFDTYKAVRHIASVGGFECQLSDKGVYQRDSIAKLGGLAEAAKLFSSGKSRAVFMKFLDHSTRPKGTHDEGCVLHGDLRTYLNCDAAIKAMGGDEASAVDLLDTLVAANVLYRGFVLGCQVCKHAGWYSLTDLTDQFRCGRCGREEPMRHDHWRHPTSPQIFYKLDEIVYQFLRHDGDVVTLALDHMSRNSIKPFSHSPELRITAKDGSLDGEIDLCAVWEGMLTIGEAKKQGQLASSEAELRKLAGKFVSLSNALYARRVVFATMSPEWKATSVDAISRAFDSQLATPIFLTAKDLLSRVV